MHLGGYFNAVKGRVKSMTTFHFAPPPPFVMELGVPPSHPPPPLHRAGKSPFHCFLPFHKGRLQLKILVVFTTQA